MTEDSGKKSKQSPPSATKVIKSRAWLSMQQMIKRSGRRCVTGLFTASEKGDANSYNFYDVIYLYSLYKVSNSIRNDSDISLNTEIFPAKSLRSWPRNYILVPALTRKKVNAFLTGQRNVIATGSATSAKINQQGIYRALLDSCKDRKILISKILEIENRMPPPGFDNEFHYLSQYYEKLSNSAYPTFTLFILECIRLHLTYQINIISKIEHRIKNHETIETLGQCLFFALLYQHEDETISIENLVSSIVQGMTYDEAIEKFVTKIKEEYLHPAEVRRKLRERKELL